MKNKASKRSNNKGNIKWISVLLCISMVVSVFPLCVYAEEIIPDDAEYVENEIVISSIKEVAGVSEHEIKNDAVKIDFEDLGIAGIEKIETYSSENVYVAEISGDVEKACRKLSRNKDITAEPNYVLSSCGFQMPLEVANNASIYAQYQKAYIDNLLNLPAAWQTHEVSGEGETIAVIDSGFFINATDFPVNLWKNRLNTVGWNIHENNDDISPIYKSNGDFFTEDSCWATRHGTNIAGVIGMASNGSVGIGAAYGAELMLIKVASYVNDERINILTTDVVEAIDFARENGAEVINLPLSTSADSSVLRSAVNRAYNAGVVVVASSANYGVGTSTQKFYPAAYSNVVGVMAIDTAKPSQLADYSDFDDSAAQSCYDIAAPGSYIIGCDVIVGSLTNFNGTSQACAFVSACAALYLEKYPEADAQDFINAIHNCEGNTVAPYPRNDSNTHRYKALDAKLLLDYVCPCKHRVCEETVISEPDCTTAGMKQLSCTKCEYTFIDTIPALGHSYSHTTVPASCTEDGTEYDYCIRCGNQINIKSLPASHTWSDWEITEYPSADYDGASERHCLKCSASETEYISLKIKDCDVSGDIITGLSVGMSVSDFTAGRVVDGVQITAVPSANGRMGTGSKVTLVYPGGQAVDYTVAVFGDADGDGWYDGTDSIIVNCLANGILSREQLGEAACLAADCNHDDIIDASDVEILERAGLLFAGIDQSKTIAELFEDSMYEEYISLISQNVSADSSADEPIDEGFNKSFIQRLIDSIVYIFKMIKSYISKF